MGQEEKLEEVAEELDWNISFNWFFSCRVIA